MSEEEESPHGAAWRFLADDHRRLDTLLDDAGDCRSAAEIDAYEQFRRGLLHHISMEEKVLLPDAQRVRGQPLAEAARLRLDHGALAALMMAPPGPRIIRAIRFVLARHNPVEENPGGVYDSCERVVGAAGDTLLAKLRATPAVPVKPWLDSPQVFEAIRHSLERAGYEPSLIDI